MNKNKLAKANLYTGIDTIEVRSDTEIAPETEADFAPTCTRKNTATGACYYKLNPDKGNNGLQIYNSTDYYGIRDYMINFLNMTNPTKTRIDFRIDSFDDNFEELLKLNKLLILLIAEAYNITNNYDTINPMTLEPLCIRIQNQYIEAENYNKGIEEPDGEVKNRLELRSKKLYDDTAENDKEHTEFMKWCKRLEKAVTKDNFERLQEKLNTALYNRYQIESRQRGFALNEFLYKYQSSIFTSRQMSNLYKVLGYKDPEQQAKKYKQRKYIEYFSHKDICNYVQMIKDSGARFFDT